MTTQPEALRLADELDHGVGTIDRVRHEAAAELRRLHQHELANDLWGRKTLWVQQSAQAEELGMHRADVLAWRIDKLRAERDALLDAVTTLARAAIEKEEGRTLINNRSYSARLIAAAPDLLEALKAMRVKYGEYACRVCDLADAAIAKAKGQL